MAQRSGFFNALKTDKGYDIKYNARDYSDNLAAIIGNGVRRSKDNELRVIASGGMALTISVGRAWIEGCWYINDAIFTGFSVPTAPTGDRSRIDRVILRLNENIEARKIELVYLTGIPASVPTAPAITREGGVYDIVLADINVNAMAVGITQSNIIDQRPNQELCGWITTPIGYDDFFQNLDDEFNEWWLGVKNTLSSTSLFKEYIWSTTTTGETTTITFNIPQYDSTGVDILNVYSNGLRLARGVDYTANGSVITFTTPKIAGTDIEVIVYKSIDGTGLKTVNEEITEIQNQLATIKNIGEYIYICNGVNDNIKLSEIAQSLFAADSDKDQLVISVYGKFGASTPYGGNGTSVSRYRWMSLGSAGVNAKRITFDFAGCSQIVLNCQAGYHYIGFYGVGINIKNANVVVHCEGTGSSFTMFSATQGYLVVDSCRFVINGYTSCIIAQTGTFNNCFGYVINSQGDSICFNTTSNSLLRVNGGEYYAITGNVGMNASVINTASSETSSIVITNAMNCPTAAIVGLYQKNAVSCSAGYGAFNDTITALTITKATNQNLRGSIPLSKPDRN